MQRSFSRGGAALLGQVKEPRPSGPGFCPGDERWDPTIGACMCPPGTKTSGIVGTCVPIKATAPKGGPAPAPAPTPTAPTSSAAPWVLGGIVVAALGVAAYAYATQ